VQFGILGPLEVTHDGEPVELRATKQRALLAVLLLHANEVVSYERLLDELWGEWPPETATKTLQVYIAALRKALGQERIVSRPRGYLLRAESDELDATRFERLVAEARGLRDAGDCEAAAGRFRQALALWRGRALADLTFESLARNEVERLEELRLAALAEWIACDLELGAEQDAVGELETLVAAHPLHERFRAQLMLALYRQGRQAEALAAYRAARTALVEELGIEPGPDLQELNRKILNQDPSLARAGRSLPTGTVTLLATDLEGSTRLLEQLGPLYADLLQEKQRLVREALRAHRGREVDCQGDSFLYVFTSTADAVAAAAEAQRRLAEHAWPGNAEVRMRIGIHTGEPAVTGDRYVGLDVHRASRICDAAHGGQVLVSQEARTLARELPAGMSFRDLGPHRLKDLKEPERLSQLSIPGLGDVFPPPRGLYATNIPRPASSFIGRSGELADLQRLLLDKAVRLVTLTGPGGSGKTRLALELAASLVPTFRDGVFWVPLAQLADPSRVLSTIAQTLGLREVDSDVLNALGRSLADQEMLLLLDNFEHLLAAAPEVAALLEAGPRLRLLVTSRASLRLAAERHFAVPPLSLPELAREPDPATVSGFDAVTLFIERVRAVKPGFALASDNAAHIAEICVRLDGLPLALELAAARAGVLPMAALLSRLESGLGLPGTGARDQPARHQTLKATIDWSYRLLDPPEQALFRRLSVFAGGWSLEAAEAVCDPEGELDVDVFLCLSSLAESSLLQVDELHGEPRFSMLETIREYALERLAEAGEDSELRRRHAEFFLDFAEATEPRLGDADQRIWLDRLEADHDNLRGALSRLQSSDDDLAFLRMAAALTRFWRNNDHLMEGRGWVEAALIAAARAPTPIRARGITAAAELRLRTGNPEGAKTLLLEALPLARELGDQHLVALGLFGLALSEAAQGAYPAAINLAEEALREIPADPPPDLRALRGRVLYMLGRFEHVCGDASRARSLYEEVELYARAVGDLHLEAVAMSAFGDLALDESDLDRAEQLHAQSLVLCRRIGSKQMIGERLGALAADAAARDDCSRAGRLWGALEAIEDRLGVVAAPTAFAWRPRYEERIMHAANGEFEAARQVGRRADLDETVADALTPLASASYS
jgi:predicted ATPase/DNA-binding SARP family transcriptional activator